MGARPGYSPYSNTRILLLCVGFITNRLKGTDKELKCRYPDGADVQSKAWPRIQGIPLTEFLEKDQSALNIHLRKILAAGFPVRFPSEIRLPSFLTRSDNICLAERNRSR